ncbi:uncharacterized protein V1510DRAFT_428634 [Dipodascopsis tothii]|uniref:uncharacterized protein n=1 Tax=Dipodascopsis tothii TaxID=44089 RepID=UPI0034CE0E35
MRAFILVLALLVQLVLAQLPVAEPRPAAGGSSTAKIELRKLDGSVAAPDVTIAFDPLAKTGRVQTPPSDAPAVSADGLLTINGQTLTDHVPASSAANEVYRLLLSPEGKVWHIDYEYVPASQAQRSVVVVGASKGAQPVLQAPITPDKPAPKPEQSFVQKYWIFIVGVLLVLLLGGGGGGGQ